jgi:hypothetical protein
MTSCCGRYLCYEGSSLCSEEERLFRKSGRDARGGSMPRLWKASAKPALEFYGHALDLRRGPEHLFTLLKSSARRTLRKAERSGLSV